jgi:chlorobactene glucosyltransferase
VLTTPAVIAHAVLIALLLAILVQTLLNARAMPRLARMPMARTGPRVAVLIPARNEAGRIGAAVGAWASQVYPDYEVVVYDDASSDGTGAIAGQAAGGAGHVRVVRGDGVPAGWYGKPYACHRLRRETRARVLVFADPDVRPGPHVLGRLVSALDRLGADALSVLPTHESPRAVVRAQALIQNWAALAFVPSWLPAARRVPLFATLPGALVAIRAAAYDAAGGFEAVRDTLGEDVALGRRLVALGLRVRPLNGARAVTCYPYASAGELWRANVRNLVPALCGSGALLLLAVSSLAALYLVPPVAVVVGLAGDGAGTLGWTWLPVAELALGGDRSMPSTARRTSTAPAPGSSPGCAAWPRSSIPVDFPGPPLPTPGVGSGRRRRAHPRRVQ